MSPVAEAVESAFARRGWKGQKIHTGFVIEAVGHASPAHLVDRFENHVTLEGERNNQGAVLRLRPEQFFSNPAARPAASRE